MKISEIRERTNEELVELEKDLRDRLIRLQIAKATQRSNNTSLFSSTRREIARIKTIQAERKLGLTDAEEAKS